MCGQSNEGDGLCCKAPKLAEWRMEGGSQGWTPPFHLAGWRTKSPEAPGEKEGHTPRAEVGQQMGLWAV